MCYYGTCWNINGKIKKLLQKVKILKIHLSDDEAELIFDWILRSQLKGNGKPGWAVNKADLHKQIGNNTNWFKNTKLNQEEL